MYVVTSKTNSFFNKTLEESGRIKLVAATYIQKHPELANLKVSVVPSFPNAFYNTGKQEFTVGLFNADIIAHELEHALSTWNAPGYMHLLGASKMLTHLSNMITPALAMGGAIAKTSTDSKDNKDKVNILMSALTAFHTAVALPLLFEEGRANFKAILNSPEKLKAFSTLAPAYATYILGAGMPVGSAQIVRKI